jgi:nucleotide-binding universal stress UspA family protein
VFRDILVAVDGSAHAERALEEAIELARSTGASLTLVSVAPELSLWSLEGAGLPPPVNPAGGLPLPTDPAQRRQQVAREHHEILDRAQTRVPEGVTASTVLLEGRVGEAILQRIRAAGHDLVAMGSHGHGELRSMVLGSVSHEVLHESPIPVLIVPMKDGHRQSHHRQAGRSDGVLERDT